MKKYIYFLLVALIAAACNSTNTQVADKSEVNKAKFQRFYDEVLNGHNIALLDSFCVPDFVDHNPEAPFTGKGIEDLRENFAQFFTAIPDIRFTTNFMIAEGDTVMAHVTMSGTNSGPMGGMPATNKQFSIEGIDVIVMKDGKATERWGFFDSMKMMQQLGMMTEPEAAEGEETK